MKKRVLLCAAALGAASMLFGFDSAETAESILAKSQEATKDMTSAVVDMTMNADVSVNIVSGEDTSAIDIAGTYDASVGMNVDPMSMIMDGELNFDVLGMTESMKMEMYGVTDENGQFTTYVYVEDSEGDGNWEYETVDLSDLNIKELMEKSANINYADYGMTFEVSPEPVDVDGIECYELSTVVDVETMKAILAKAEELGGEAVSEQLPAEELDMVLSMLGGIKMNIVYYIDTETFEEVAMHMDLNDSDMSAISQFAAMALGEMSEDSSVEIVLNDVSIDADVEYNVPVEVEVPQEALDAVANGTAVSAADMIAVMDDYEYETEDWTE